MIFDSQQSMPSIPMTYNYMHDDVLLRSLSRLYIRPT